MEEHELGHEPHLAQVDREEEPPLGHVVEHGTDGFCEIIRPLAAIRILRTESGIRFDHRVEHVRLPHEMAGRVDGDHRRSEQAVQMHIRVVLRQPRAVTRAEQADPFVTERLTSRLSMSSMTSSTLQPSMSTP